MKKPVKCREKVGKGHPPKRTRFKPGQSGNPKGLKKGTRHLSTILKEFLSANINISDPLTTTDKKVKMMLGDALVRKLLKSGVEGDLQAIKEIFDRSEGRAVQRQEVDLNVKREDLSHLTEAEMLEYFRSKTASENSQ